VPEVFQLHPAVLVLLALILCAGGYYMFQLYIRPLFISKVVIDTAVKLLIAEHGPRALEVARAEEEHAARYCHFAEQGRCRRVRRALERLENARRADDR
jgi:hypothetical protein